MKDATRYAPGAVAAVALLGCLLPFAAGGDGNIFALPDAFAQAGQFVGAVGSMSAERLRSGGFDPAFAVWVARLVYLAPLAALWIVILNLRGAVEKRRLLEAGIVWIAAVVFVPPVAGQVLISSNTALRQFNQLFGGNIGTFSLNFGVGGWLIVLAAVAAILMALGVVKLDMSRA